MKRSDAPLCKCGDYKEDHENGTGWCRMPDDLCHGFEPCESYWPVEAQVLGGKKVINISRLHYQMEKRLRCRPEERDYHAIGRLAIQIAEECARQISKGKSKRDAITQSFFVDRVPTFEDRKGSS
jgi:hypothetical protein